MSLCRVWRTRWHRARDVGAISAKGSQSGDRTNCEVKCRSTGRRPNRKPRTRRSWIGRSVICNQENVAEASVHRSLPLGAASTQPFLSNLFQWEPRRHDSSFHLSKGEPTAVYGVQHQPAPATAVHQVLGTWGKDEPIMEGAGGECEESASREYGYPRQLFATNGSLAASVFVRVEFSSDSTCEGDGGEFNSPRRGEETRGRQWAARGDNSCEQYTAVRTCHTRKHFRVWLTRSSRFAARTVLCHVARWSPSQAHFMSHAQCTWLDRILLPLQHRTPSSLCPAQRSIRHDPQHGVQFGRFAEQCSMTVYEPNDSVEESSTEVTTVLSPPRRASIGSIYNPGEDSNHTCIIGSGWRTKFGTAGFTVVDCQVHHTFHTSTERLVAMNSHRGKSSLDANVFRSLILREREVFLLSVEKPTIFVNGKQIRPPKVNRQLWRKSLKWNIIRDCFLKNRRSFCCLKHGPRWICKNQGSKAQTGLALRESRPQIHSQRMELCQANQSSDHAQREKDRFCSELEDRERALLRTRIRTLQEMKKNSKKFLLYRSWQSSTVEPRRFFWIRKRKSIYSESVYGSNREIKKIKWILWTIPGISVILRRQAALGDPTFPVTLWLFEIFLECSQLDTLTLYRTSGNVFEDLLAPKEPTAACLGNGRCVTDFSCRRSLSAKIVCLPRNQVYGNAFP